MALFVDSARPTVQDLLKYDRNVLDIGSAESLDSSEKLSLARGQVASELEAFLRRERPGTRLDSIVATEPLRRWVAETALGLIYRDAHYSQLSDKYRTKWHEYDRLARETRRFLFDNGIGCVGAPVPKAAKPVVGATSGFLPAGSYFVKMNWIGLDGQQGEASELVAFRLSSPGGLLISPASAPEWASGWHVYAGAVEDRVLRQNTSPLQIPGNWEASAPVLIEGEEATEGQLPSYFVSARNVMQRG
ncbi:MAG: hypothetical protein JNL98_11160 [Bryobacterales bacterium]|nr:hypothetical protein [Bryobacterales bacterium]